MSEILIDIGSGGNGPPSPRANPDLIGHEAQERLLLATLIDSGRMAHAWLFTGPRGIGKATLAYRFARYLLASGAVESKGPKLFGDMLPATFALLLPAIENGGEDGFQPLGA